MKVGRRKERASGPGFRAWRKDAWKRTVPIILWMPSTPSQGQHCLWLQGVSGSRTPRIRGRSLTSHFAWLALPLQNVGSTYPANRWEDKTNIWKIGSTHMTALLFTVKQTERGSGFLKVGQLINGIKTPSSTQVEKPSVSHPKALHFPEPTVVCRGNPPTPAPRQIFPARLTYRERERAQQGLLLRKAPTQNPLEAERCTAAHIWHSSRPDPRRAAPRPETSARGDVRAAACVSSLRPLSRPPPQSGGALSPRSGRTPGAAPGTAWLAKLAALLRSGCERFEPGQPGAAGSNAERTEPGRTHICKRLSKALALQACPIGARAGREEPWAARGGPAKSALGGQEATGEGPGPPPAGFRRGQGSQKPAGSRQRREPRLTRGAE